MWTRREVLTTALGVAATALLPVTDVPRPGAEWIEEAEALERRAGQLGPTATATNAGRLRHRLDVAIEATPRARDRLPLHVAAAIAGAVAARAVRWAGADPASHLEVAMEHARTAHDGPALATVLLQQAAAAIDVTGPIPNAIAREASRRAIWEAGASRSAANVRAIARWDLAWHIALSGDRDGALAEASGAAADARRAGWPAYLLHGCHGELLARCGFHHAAQHDLVRALSAPPVVRVGFLTNLARSCCCSGDADAAATHLEEAVHLARACRAPGRLARIRAVRAQIPPGPHRAQLDDVLRG